MVRASLKRATMALSRGKKMVQASLKCGVLSPTSQNSPLDTHSSQRPQPSPGVKSSSVNNVPSLQGVNENKTLVRKVSRFYTL